MTSVLLHRASETLQIIDTYVTVYKLKPGVHK